MAVIGVRPLRTYVSKNVWSCDKYRSKDTIFSKSEFESTARKMGYINGYLWGKEYPTNGKRPELDDDIQVDWFGDGEWNSTRLGYLDWSTTNPDLTIIEMFKIIDPRYKPEQENFTEDERFGIMPPVNKNECCSMSAPSKPWFEAGELPPVGAKCEMLTSKKWVGVYVVGIDNDSGRLVVRYLDTGEYFGHTPEHHLYRPIRTGREKAIEAACNIPIEIGKSLFESLYDAGLLRLPDQK